MSQNSDGPSATTIQPDQLRQSSRDNANDGVWGADSESAKRNTPGSQAPSKEGALTNDEPVDTDVLESALQNMTGGEALPLSEQLDTAAFVKNANSAARMQEGAHSMPPLEQTAKHSEKGALMSMSATHGRESNSVNMAHATLHNTAEQKSKQSNKLQKNQNSNSEGVDADEEDNSDDLLNGNGDAAGTEPPRQRSKPYLRILKFDATAEGDGDGTASANGDENDYQTQNESTNGRIHESQGQAFGDDGCLPKVMVNRDLSPLSPVKPRYLGEKTGMNQKTDFPSDTMRRLDSNVTASEATMSRDITQGESGGFQGLKLKNLASGIGGLADGDVLKSASVPPGGDGVKRDNIIPANPLLPKQVLTEPKQPPQCPLKDIQFVQLQKFKRFKEQQACKMGDGFDQIGKKNMMRENREKRRKYDEQKKEAAWRRGAEDEEHEAKMDEFTHIIQNIVYARDPKIFDTKNGFVNQRCAFQHENMLDIKNLIRINEERSGGSERFGAPRLPPPKRVLKTRQQILREQELEAKARYRLRELEDGTIDRLDRTLLFESRFESGNLYLAQKVSDHEYNVLMQNDINTSGHTQWFFYQVKNTRKNLNVQFNIMNFTKPDSLFNYGMKMSIYSEKRSEKSEGAIGWHKGGERISYYGNGIKKDVCYTSKGYYTASFTYKFLHDDDTVYFAYCFPYTYSDLMQDIYEIESDPARRAISTRKTLCKTLAGVDCEMLTVTEKGDFEKMQAKRAVVLSARVHPGETVGSWMMRGVLMFLTDPDNEEAKLLRERFIFKIIPMLNPDGVVNGNYRCSLAGCDLNRRWKVPHRQLHPTIYYTKKLIRDQHNERGLLLYCDLHGHSRKQNVFMYGCNNKAKPEECRVFPLILSKLSKSFHFPSCRFGVQKSKESTARVSLYKELKTCPNIFTMESTFSGIDQGEWRGQHMTQCQFEEMGRDLCRTLLIYENIYVPPELRHLYGNRDEADGPADMSALFSKELQDNKKLIAAGDGDSSGGSDSEPSEDNLPVDEAAKVVPIVDKQQKLQLQKIQKRKAQEEKDNNNRKLPVKKPDDSPPRQQQPRQRSPFKKVAVPEPTQPKPAEEKKETKKKPEMKDACTQTDRSDYQRIKKQQQQLKLMQEMKEQRMRGQEAYMPYAQYKSPDKLVAANQVRKTPQSQTGHRGPSGNIKGNYALSNQIQNSKQGGQQHERQLEDMRNPQKYQLSQDKYSLFQVQNFGHNKNNSQGNNMNMPMNTSNGAAAKNSIIFQNPQNQASKNNNMMIQMSQINSINSGVGGVRGPPVGARNPHGQAAAQQQQMILNGLQGGVANKPSGANATPGNPNGGALSLPTFNKNKTGKLSEINESGDNIERAGTNSNANNLRGPGSTISKAGELILQKSSNFNSPKKSGNIANNAVAQNDGTSVSGGNLGSSTCIPSSTMSTNNRTKNDLRFQIQSITSSHFGAIHMGGNMSFMKDSNFLSNLQKQIEPASATLAGGARAGTGASGSLYAANQNPSIASKSSPKKGSAPVSGGDSRHVQQIRNGNSNQTAGAQGEQAPTKAESEIAKHGGGPGYRASAQLTYEQEQNQIQVDHEDAKRRGSQGELRRNSNSQIQQNSRNYQEMDNVKLFQSPQNSRAFIRSGNTQNTNNSGPAQVITSGQQNISGQNQTNPNGENTPASFDRRRITADGSQARTNRADIHPTTGAPSRLVQSVAITLKTCCMGVTIQMDGMTRLTLASLASL